MDKKRRKLLKQQLKSIRSETDNPAIINDVIDLTELEAYPDHIEQALEHTTEQAYLNPTQAKTVQNNTDGKTWNTDHNRR